MKYFVTLLLIGAYSSFAFADTTCHWKKVRGGGGVQYDSNMINPQNVQDCFHFIKKPVVLLEPFEDQNEFQGTVLIADAKTSEVLSSCETLTVKGLIPTDDFDQNRVQYFFNDVAASGDNSGDTTTNSPKWQNYFDSKIKLNCQ